MNVDSVRYIIWRTIEFALTIHDVVLALLLTISTQLCTRILSVMLLVALSPVSRRHMAFLTGHNHGEFEDIGAFG